MNLYSVHLHCQPSTRFHWGAVQRDAVSSMLHADTIFGAIVENAALLVEAPVVAELVEAFGKGELAISSAFPALWVEQDAQGQWVDFLPRPHLPHSIQYRQDQHKKVKRLRYLSPAYAQQLARGRALQWDLLQAGLCFGRAFAWAPEDGKPQDLSADGASPYTEAEAPKVKVHTVEKEGRLHPESSVSLQQHTYAHGVSVSPHYHFLLACRDKPDDHPTLAAALRLMPDQGLGGERSTGAGLFKSISWQKASWPQPDQADAYWHLAPSYPRDASEFEHYLTHDLMTRGGGFLPGGRRTPQLRMMTEGCVSKEPVEGRLLELSDHFKTDKQPDHPIYRYGRALALPIQRPPEAKQSPI